jgi:hypothetical protein
MKGQLSVWGYAGIGVLVSTLAACGGGGGGGGGGYGGGTPTPAATASFSQPAQALSINYGQAVQLTWSSAYATSCTGSVSSGGGSFTGNQSTSGSATVVPTAPGTYTYTLQCTGTGGNGSGSSPTITVKPSIISAFASNGKITTIGSTVDPSTAGSPGAGDQNPYGLTIAPATQGLITKGDLVICNFNDGPTNTQGLGTTIVGLHPTAGSTPYHIAQSATLQGCNALAMLPDDSISAAAWSSNMNPLVSAAGAVGQPFQSDTFNNPWGEAFVAATASQPAALYVSTTPGGANNTASGTIQRISLDVDAQTSITQIANGFCTSGAPGAIFGPSGLTYDASNDTLYIIDTASNSVVAFTAVSKIGANGVVVNGTCGTGATVPTPEPTFTGPSASSAKVIAHGAPLNTPLSAALLADGDLVVGNADIGAPGPSATTNLLIEVSPVLPGGFVDKPLQLDSGAPGALFGIAATTDANGNQIVYFNDDNAQIGGSTAHFGAVLELTVSTTSTGGPTPY